MDANVYLLCLTILQYGAEKNACVKLVSLPELKTVGNVKLDFPTAIACSDKYIVAGTLQEYRFIHIALL